MLVCETDLAGVRTNIVSKNKFLIKPEEIQNSIQEIRGQKIIIDSDLARFYGVDTRRLNEQVKRNKQRFPDDN